MDEIQFIAAWTQSWWHLQSWFQAWWILHPAFIPHAVIRWGILAHGHVLSYRCRLVSGFPLQLQTRPSMCFWLRGRASGLVWGEDEKWGGWGMNASERGGVEAREGETSKTSGNLIPPPRSDKAGSGVQRQRKRDPPCDRERYACLPCLAPFSFSVIQLY